MPALALRALFDADVAVEVLTDFSQAEPLREAESKRLSRAVPRRLEEFAAGRNAVFAEDRTERSNRLQFTAA